MLSQKGFGIHWKSSSKSTSDLTGLAGLLWFAQVCSHLKLFKSIDSKKSCAHQWSAADCAIALVLMHLAGCSCIDDIDSLRNDTGWHQLWHKSRRQKNSEINFGPSKSTLHRSLLKLNEQDLMQCNRKIIDAIQHKYPQKTATLDQDATIISSDQPCSEWTYKSIRGFQPSTVTWHEQQLVIASEYRRGNVPAKSGIVDQLKKGVTSLPSTVEQIYYRGDSASYQKDVINYCRKQSIGFSISGVICQEIRDECKSIDETTWQPLLDKDGFKTDETFMELPVVPDWAEGLRYIVVKRPLSSQTELALDDLPPKQVMIKNQRYKLSLIVTNRKLNSSEIIHWHRQRCGYGEAIHSCLRNDCAGDWTPSKAFEANAVWWTIAVIAHNLNELMKRYLAIKSSKRLKSVRLKFIHIPGRLVHHARQVIIVVDQAFYQMLERLQLSLGQPPPLNA